MKPLTKDIILAAAMTAKTVAEYILFFYWYGYGEDFKKVPDGQAKLLVSVPTNIFITETAYKAYPNNDTPMFLLNWGLYTDDTIPDWTIHAKPYNKHPESDGTESGDLHWSDQLG